MNIYTSRFGTIEVHDDQIFLFPTGLLGFPSMRRVVLLVNQDEPHIVWLQSLVTPQLAFAAVSPQPYVPEYRVRVPAAQLAQLPNHRIRRLHVLCLISEHNGQLCMNLKAPVLIDQPLAVGCQVVVLDDWPTTYPIAAAAAKLHRRAA